jgi:hypothetical protein
MGTLKTASRWMCGITFAILPALPALAGRDSSVCIATGDGLHGPGIESRWGPGTNPAFFTIGTRSFPGVKRLECGVDHLLPSGAEVNGK